jgi:poly(3-hydroxybutyrate) depolymerase
MKFLFNLLSLAAVVYAQESNIPECNTGPNSITEAALSGFAATVPQVCVEATGTQGGERCFYIYVPDCAAADSPLVFDIHGFGSCPLFSTAYTGWMALARDNCFVLLMPLGTIDPEISEGSCFMAPGGIPQDDGSETNGCCCNKDEALADPDLTNDDDLMRLMAKTAVEEVPGYSEGRVTIDTKRIYMAGHSNGCVESLSMAAVHSDMVAAVCCHSGVGVTDFAADYSAVPVWMAFGLKDTEFTEDGSVGASGLAWPKPETVYSSYADKNGCDATETVSPVSVDGAEVGNVKTRSSNCDNGAEVSFLALTESGHFPYQNYPESNVGASTTTLDTTIMAWEFCSRFSKSEVPDFSVGIEYLAREAPTVPDSPTAAPDSAAAAALKRTTVVITIVSITVASFVFM